MTYTKCKFKHEFESHHPHLFYYLTNVVMTEQEKKELEKYKDNLLTETIEMKEKKIEELKLLLNYIS